MCWGDAERRPSGVQTTQCYGGIVGDGDCSAGVHEDAPWSRAMASIISPAFQKQHTWELRGPVRRVLRAPHTP